MKTIFQAQNINCGSCSNLIKGSLEDKFGTIDVNLDVKPVEVTVDIEENQKSIFKEEMADLGFDIICELNS